MLHWDYTASYSTVPGETTPPWKQDIPNDKKESKTDQVFWNANTSACKIFHNKKYDGFHINCYPENFSGAKESVSHDDLKDLLNKVTKTKLQKQSEYNEQLQNDYKFFIKHVVKKHRYLQFLKCYDPTCIHCKENPIKATKFVETMNNMGGHIPSPKPCTIHDGHYKTLLKVLMIPKPR